MKFCLYLFIAILFASCASRKVVVNNYLQDRKDSSGVIFDSIPRLPIQVNDMLTIAVYSTAFGTTPQVDAPYNLPADRAGLGFLVDENGNIDYPQLGTLHVAGMTRQELAQLIRSRLQTQLTQPTVIVRFANFRFTILGEVGSPNTYTIPNEHITILEALGLGGDITEYGRKDNIKVIREKENMREIGIINLTTDSLFASNYYHLQQNDVILVDRTTRRLKQQEQQALVQQIGIATSILTALALILNLIR